MNEGMYCRICLKRNPLYEANTWYAGEYWCVECGDYSVAPLSQHFDRLNDLIEWHYNKELEEDEDPDYDERS